MAIAPVGYLFFQGKERVDNTNVFNCDLRILRNKIAGIQGFACQISIHLDRLFYMIKIR